MATESEWTVLTPSGGHDMSTSSCKGWHNDFVQALVTHPGRQLVKEFAENTMNQRNLFQDSQRKPSSRGSASFSMTTRSNFRVHLGPSTSSVMTRRLRLLITVSHVQLSQQLLTRDASLCSRLLGTASRSGSCGVSDPVRQPARSSAGVLHPRV